MPRQHPFYTVYPLLRPAEVAVERLSLKHRSVLVKCCQAQYLPSRRSPDSSLKRLVTDLPPVTSAVQIQDALDYYQQFKNLVEGPLTSSILLDMCRGSPLPIQEIKEARADSWFKEIELCEGVKRVDMCNWKIAFFPESAGEPFLPDIPINRAINQYLYLQFRRWRESIRGSRLYPRATHKNMSWDTRREVESETGISLMDVPIFGQDNWCRLYHDTGIMVEGVSEMRQKWYPSGAKPRTYYAQGGTHYRASRHLQDIFSSFHDSILTTHRVFRLLPGRFRFEEGEHFRIYDLKSFTSNFSEQHAFVEQLSRFCEGVPVYLMDEREGPVLEDLGHLIREYNSICNFYPSVTYERYLGVEHEGIHGIASMLGIFGNLMTCTVAHGVALLQLFEDESSCNVAGDDAIFRENDNAFYADEIICSLGTYERTKTFESDEPGAICLKRPIMHGAGRLDLGLAIIPPTGALIRVLARNISDPRYSFLGVEDWTWNRKVSVAGRDLLRFLRSAWRARSRLDTTDVELIQSIYQSVAEGFGCSGPSTYPYFFPAFPDYSTLSGDTDPLICTLLTCYKDVAVLPRLVPMEEVERPDSMSAGSEFLGCRSPHMRWLEMLEYVESEKQEELVYGAEGFRRLTESFEDRPDGLVVLYKYTVLRDIPVHLQL